MSTMDSVTYLTSGLCALVYFVSGYAPEKLLPEKRCRNLGFLAVYLLLLIICRFVTTK